jgi:histidine triad (HIT) family protein
MRECLFCKIANGSIPSTHIYEDAYVLAFLDIAQTTPGHTLVIPKKHSDHFLNTTKSLMHRVMDVAQRIGQAQMISLQANGVNLITNAHPAAGQTVFHFHVHVIPRYDQADQFRLEMLENKDRHLLNLPMIASKIKTKLGE